MAPVDPLPHTVTAGVTIAESTATIGDQAISGHIELDTIDESRVTGILDIDFEGELRVATAVDAVPRAM
jgi:hypothetical protein